MKWLGGHVLRWAPPPAREHFQDCLLSPGTVVRLQYHYHNNLGYKHKYQVLNFDNIKKYATTFSKVYYMQCKPNFMNRSNTFPVMKENIPSFVVLKHIN